MKKTLYWTPRIFGIIFALFVSLFALDMFSEGKGFFEAFLGFLIHLTPSYLIIAALILAWKNEKLGGILFILLWGSLLLIFRFKLQTAVFLSPLILIGILFLLNYFYNNSRGHNT